MLLRSVTPFSIDSPHTGTTHYDSSLPLIPAAAISVEDAEMF
jgi:carboxypeptidase Q